MVKAVIGEGILSEIRSTPVDSNITFLRVLDGDLEVVSFSSISERVLIFIWIQASAGQTVFSLAEKLFTSSMILIEVTSDANTVPNNTTQVLGLVLTRGA